MKFCSMIVAYNEEELIRGCLLGLQDLDNFVIISKPWFGKHRGFDETETITKNMKATIIKKDFREEKDQRNYMMIEAQNRGYDYVFIVDADEYYTREDIQKAIKFIEDNAGIKRFNVGTCKYIWKNPNWETVPRYNNIIPMCYRSDMRFNGLRNIVVLTSELKILPEDIIMYHFSYAGSTKRIRMKLEHFSHAKEMKLNWIEEIYKKWTPEMENLHPSITAPHRFKKAIPFNCPNVIKLRFYGKV